MAVLRERWFLLACAVLLAAAVVGGAWGASSAVRARWWARTAAQPLAPREAEALDACGEVPWEAWLKVLAADPELSCGEAWAARALAEAARGPDKAAWIEARVTDPTTPAGARVRAAAGLVLAGRVPPREPMFLLAELDPPRAEAWVAAAVADEELAVQLGPRTVALRQVALAERGELEPRQALPALRWLALVPADEARAVADRALTRLGSVDAALAEELGDRRRRRFPVGEPPAPDRRALAGCEAPPCLEARLAVLEAMTGESADGGPPAAPAEALPRVPPELAEPDTLAAAALGWEISALRRWLEVAPDRGARLAALLGRSGTGSVLALGWDGSGTPWAVADLARLLVDEPVEVRADRADTVWLGVGWGWVPRSCGAPAPEVAGATFDEPAIRARAVLELATEEQRASGAALVRARALDPGLPAPAPRGDPVAFRIGATLAPPPAAEGDRGVGSAGPWCPTTPDGR